MSFFKKIAEVVIRSAGYPLPGETSQSANPLGAQGGFNQILGRMQQQNNLVAPLKLPEPPIPPADPSDSAAQRKYNEALLLYNQQFRGYHTQMMQAFSQRFLIMQQALLQARQTQPIGSSTLGNASYLSRSSSVGVGGILPKDTDI